ncbi:MAG: hypothetical protein ACT4O9_01900 [Blastocatellia bacterium]
MPKTAFILTLILFVQSLSSCGGTASYTDNRQVSASSNAANAAAKTANDNIEELGMIVRLSLEPEEVVWHDEPVADRPQERKLTAVLLYLPANATKIISETSKHGPPVSSTITVQDWYPNELISQNDLADEQGLKGTTYRANEFVKAPFLEGTVTNIDGTDYFILELTAKP